MTDDNKMMLVSDLYNRQLYFILRDRMGNGGWPPRNLAAVCGWTVTRLLAASYCKPVTEVAGDIIQRACIHGDPP